MTDQSSTFRKSIYALLIAMALGSLIGTILKVESRSGINPFLSANDISRWSTIRSLVDHGTYSIDEVMYARDKSTRLSTIDKVYHLGPDGKRHFYSSKPPLLPTLLAGEYWLIKNTIGISIAEHPFYVGRMMLIITHGGLLLLYFLILIQLLERYGKTDWGRLFVFSCAAFGTFITTFGVTLNNHLIAAVFCLIAINSWLLIWVDGKTEYRHFFITGLAAAFTAANELPALSIFGLLGFSLLIKFPKQTLIAGVPGALIVIVAFFATNYLAHNSWRPPYLHRHDGIALTALPTYEKETLNQAKVNDSIRDAFQTLNYTLSAEPEVQVREEDKRWVIDDAQLDRRWALQVVDDKIEIRQWDNWYDYRGTYWKAGEKQGVDRGEPSRLLYAFHMLVGHHGVFSLSPIWILSVCGVGMIFYQKEGSWRQFACMVVFLTVLCVLFYIFRPLKDRNYGGVCCGFRWLFWLIPLWIVTMIPVADWCSNKKWAWYGSTVLLGVSVISASYAALNPWRHPWMYTYLEYLGWIVE